MSFTETEKSKIRHHLGYPQVGETSTFALGLPSPLQQSYMIEGAMNKVTPAGESEVRRHIGILDLLEQQMVDDFELLAVEELASIKINTKEQEALVNRYLYWRAGLANCFNVIPNSYDIRFTGMFGGAGINKRVM